MGTITSLPYYNYLIIFASFVLFAVSIWHWLQSGGFGGKIISGFTMIFLAYVALDFLYNIHLYGDRVMEVKADETRKNAEIAISRPKRDESITESLSEILAVIRGTGEAKKESDWWENRDAVSSHKPQETPLKAEWLKYENDGTIPVNEWSRGVRPPLGCKTTFAFGASHRVQYRYYSDEWKDYMPGTSPEVNELRFMVTRQGITDLPYAFTCS